MTAAAVDPNFAEFAYGDSPLLRHLRHARRQWMAAIVVDTLAITLLGASVLFAGVRVLGLVAVPAGLWIFPAAVAASMAVVIVRRPTLLAAAARLDGAAGSAELISSALLVGQSADPWSRLIVEQAAARIKLTAKAQRWQRLSAGTRGSAVLLAAAVTLGSLLIQPGAELSAVTASGEAKLALPNTALAAAWVASPPLGRTDDELQEAGRPVPTETAAPGLQRPRAAGDDAAGGGQADSREQSKISLAVDRNLESETGQPPATGSGVATASPGNDAPAGGRLASDPSDHNPADVKLSTVTDAASGSYRSAASVEARYRLLIQAYFAR